MKFLFYLLAKLNNMEVFYLQRSIFITKTISTINLGLPEFKKKDSKKTDQARTSIKDRLCQLSPIIAKSKFMLGEDFHLNEHG